MLTTTIGAYAVPDGLEIDDGAESDDRAKDALDRATIDAVKEQVDLGIDIPADGELGRGHAVRFHCRHLKGIHVEPLTEEQRHGDAATSLPTITAPVLAGPAFMVRRWQVAQSATRKPVKTTLPGPMTIAENVDDDVYQGDAAARGEALALALNVEIRRLADAGCPVIQLGEPAFLRNLDDALAFGLEHLDRCFHRVAKTTERVVHLGAVQADAPDTDEDERPDAEPKQLETYAELATVLQDVSVDTVAIEDARCPKDLSLLERFTRTKVILGVIDVTTDEVEDMEAVRARLLQAKDHIDLHRLIAAPDDGLRLTDKRLVRQKLRVLAEAAQSI
ncbi:MAG: cobalamin-independent methionine synthase II family protein [Geminicoccaceae bacterium]